MNGVWAMAVLSLAQTQHPEPASPTARETYVGCSLLVQGTGLAPTRSDAERTYWLDSSGCYLVAVRALSEHSRDPVSGASSGRMPQFCPPESLNVSVHDVRPLAAEYLHYFERRAAEVANHPALPVFLQAMIERWPCP